MTQSYRNRGFFVTILSTLKNFTSTLRVASFCYYYVQSGKNILSNFNCFDKEAFELASVHSQISLMIAGMYLKFCSDCIRNHLFRLFWINEIYWLSLWNFLLGRWEVFSLVKIGYILLLYKFSPFYLHFLLFCKSYFYAFPHSVLGGWQVCNNISTIQLEKPGIKFAFLSKKIVKRLD